MSTAVVLVIDLGAPEDTLRAARGALASRFRSREVAASRPGAATAVLDAAEGGPVVAVLACTDGPGPALSELVQEVRRRSPELPVLAVTGRQSQEGLIELLESGVDDFCSHPGDAGDLRARLWRLAGVTEPGEVPERTRERVALRNLVGRSPGFREVLRRIPLVAQADSTVLVTGETGTGKEIVSRAIHHLSGRSSRPFVPVNCGALPFDLVENELFGHERAAFTGADRARAGLIAEAEGGTLLLDEVDSLPPGAQVKLLRFLQDREYRRLGSARVERADVRVIAATNTDVDGAVAAGRLRRDLFYRLNVLPLRLPALAERRDDIPLLARHFLALHARSLGRPCPALPAPAAEALTARDWPGNVRELSHVVERAVLIRSEPRIRAADLMLARRVDGTSLRLGQMTLDAAEELLIRNALERCEGNVQAAAEQLGVSRSALYRRMEKYGT